ncbi:MAG TPA: monovalent cation:proton antiporter-2 (CPA2) family protein [Xanthobacteraceae bacterium]
MDHGAWLKDALVFLAAAGLVVPLFHRARIGAVLGFLLVGIAVGPYGLGQLAADVPWLRYLTIEDRARVEPFAELGVLFLLFLIGLELSLGRLRSLRRYVAGIGSLQFLLSALAIGAGLAWLAMPAGSAAVLGLCLAMSSTAIVMQLLEEQGRSATPVGRVALAVLLFQDLMVAPVLFGVEILAHGAGNAAVSLAAALLQAGVVVVAIVAAGRYVLRPIFRFAAQTGSRDLIMAITLFIVVGVAAATGTAGLSSALGAFLAGLLLSETEYRHQVEIDIAPFKGLLIGLFFITVGMTIDIRAVWGSIGVVVAAVAGLLAVKAVILFAASRALGVSVAVAAEVAMLLAQGGEFAFVVIALARSNALLADEIAQLAAAVVGISMMMTPLSAAAAQRLGRRLQRVDHRHHLPTQDASELRDHVVIGGYGRVGQTVARLLAAENVPFVALDTSGALVAQFRKRGQMCFFGDAGRPEMLARVGAAHARAFVVTVNARQSAERMVAAARKQRSDALVFARAIDAEHAARLLALGAVEVIPEAVEASLQLGGRLLEGLGLSDEAVARRLDELRDAERAQLEGARANGGYSG